MTMSNTSDLTSFGVFIESGVGRGVEVREASLDGHPNISLRTQKI